MKIINQEIFANEILQDTSGMLYVVDFFAEWCGPCKVLSPVLEQLQIQYEGKIEVVKIDIDADQALAEEYAIMSIPTVIVFRNGEKLETINWLKWPEFWGPFIDGLLVG